MKSPHSIFNAQERREIRERYDLPALIRDMMAGGQIRSYEQEVSDEMHKRLGEVRDLGGILVPYCALVRDSAETLGRPQSGVIAGIGGNGTALVSTDLLADGYINPLSARLVTRRAGAVFLDGLRGNVALPKGSNVSTVWVTIEGGAVGETNPTFSQVVGTPHTLGAYTDITRQLVTQSSLPVQQLVGELILQALARGIDVAAFSGSGIDGQPVGLLGTSGVASIDGIAADAPTRADILRFVAALDGANVETEKAVWIAGAAVKAKLAGTLDLHIVKNVAGTDNVGGVAGAHYLLDNGKIEGYPFLTSGLCPAKSLFFGDFTQMIVGGWGDGVTLTVDPYSRSKDGGVRIVVMKDVDIMVRHGEAFAKGVILS